jgi:molybdopterin-guanine dinucleotide biosynthesis protein A
MGADKASLDWGGTTLAAHVAAVVARAVDGPVVVVGAPGQPLPPLPDGVETAEDARHDLGPLEGMAAGLRRVGGRADLVFVAAVDLPLLTPDFVRSVLARLTDAYDAAVPRAAGHDHPLAAAYRSTIQPAVERLVAADRLRARDLLGELRVAYVGERELADPDCLRNANTPQELRELWSSRR